METSPGAVNGEWNLNGGKKKNKEKTISTNQKKTAIFRPRTSIETDGAKRCGRGLRKTKKKKKEIIHRQLCVSIERERERFLLCKEDVKKGVRLIQICCRPCSHGLRPTVGESPSFSFLFLIETEFKKKKMRWWWWWWRWWWCPNSNSIELFLLLLLSSSCVCRALSFHSNGIEGIIKKKKELEKSKRKGQA